MLLGPKRSASNSAASKRGLMELHPGAARYYREAGVLE